MKFADVRVAVVLMTSKETSLCLLRGGGGGAGAGTTKKEG